MVNCIMTYDRLIKRKVCFEIKCKKFQMSARLCKSSQINSNNHAEKLMMKSDKQGERKYMLNLVIQIKYGK